MFLGLLCFGIVAVGTQEAVMAVKLTRWLIQQYGGDRILQKSPPLPIIERDFSCRWDELKRPIQPKPPLEVAAALRSPHSGTFPLLLCLCLAQAN
jgi:hypothetical protein